jgi:hypothetical protein
MLNLHQELGAGSMPDGRQVRVLQHVNGACFWMTVGDKSTYFISTQKLFQALMAAVEPLELAKKSQSKEGDDGNGDAAG